MEKLNSDKKITLYTHAGADIGFSRGGGADFQKFLENCRLFLGRPNCFSELSQSTKKTLVWLNILRRRQ